MGAAEPLAARVAVAGPARPTREGESVSSESKLERQRQRESLRHKIEVVGASSVAATVIRAVLKDPDLTVSKRTLKELGPLWVWLDELEGYQEEQESAQEGVSPRSSIVDILSVACMAPGEDRRAAAAKSNSPLLKNRAGVRFSANKLEVVDEAQAADFADDLEHLAESLLGEALESDRERVRIYSVV